MYGKQGSGNIDFEFSPVSRRSYKEKMSAGELIRGLENKSIPVDRGVTLIHEIKAT